LVIKAFDPDGSGSVFKPKLLDPDPDEMNVDPQPCTSLPALEKHRKLQLK
jgi:hypothetical protein